MGLADILLGSGLPTPRCNDGQLWASLHPWCFDAGNPRIPQSDFEFTDCGTKFLTTLRLRLSERAFHADNHSLEARTTPQLHPVVAPQVSHFLQVPFCTSVMFWHSGQASPR